MKTVIVYVSVHHQNTKKLVDAIAQVHEVDIIDALSRVAVHLEEYDCIGFASGIVFSKFYPQMIQFMENYLPENKKVFFLYTCGMKQSRYTQTVKKIAIDKGCQILGEHGCLGYDTFGPFKLIGGIAKGHPTDKEIKETVEFFERIIK